MRLLVEAGIRLVLTVFVSWSILFFALQLLPGDADQRLRGIDGTSNLPSEDSSHEDSSLLQSYLSWMYSLLSFRFPPTIYANRDVESIVIPAFWYSCMVISMGFTCSVFFCIILLRFRRVGGLITTFFLAPPRFIIALLLSLIFSDVLGILPVWSPRMVIQSIVPFVTLTLVSTVMLFQYTLQRVELEQKKDHAQVARAFGACNFSLYWNYIFPIILPGIILHSGAVLSILFSVIAVLERMFAVPGIGNVLMNAILTKDIPLIQASAGILITIIVILLNTSLYLAKALLPGEDPVVH